MKRTIKLCAVAFAAGTMLTSCFTYTTVVGKGAQGNESTKEWNHYVLWGLAPVDVSDAKEMAGGASDYTVTTKQSFVNGLISGITFGIYSPTTTVVTK
ncbi:Bor family protein [uncultured Flavobacterium sp.]|uniref:Bor family protein n=1 Tax=uncultured Flavobacterium sp. TaxID=165435 RepID=UPI0025F0EF60|nr:Bor family protein [uncultured Flavobacterium sp.]